MKRRMYSCKGRKGKGRLHSLSFSFFLCPEERTDAYESRAKKMDINFFLAGAT
jgi:hypothetical protein